MPFCQQEGRDCYSKFQSADNTCKVHCEGLYADVNFVNTTVGKTSRDIIALQSLMAAYKAYKEMQVKSMTLASNNYSIVPLRYHPLQVVQIYFSTATYDKIVNDVSVSLGDQISAIGGTMGLFAGFSILSAIEVLYFMLKFLSSLMSKSRMKI